MSRLTKFKHWIFNSDKRPLYEQGANILAGDINTLTTTTGQPANLKTSPTGWRNITIKYGRNVKYLGLFRDFTVPLTFAKEAARIIKSFLWGVNFEAQLYYGFSLLDQYSFPATYSPAYIGEIDLSKYRQNRDGIEVTVVEGGPAKYLKANESTTYDIILDEDEEAKTVYLDGFPFKNNVEWTIYSQAVKAFGAGSLRMTLGAGVILQEGSSQGVLIGDQTLEEDKDFEAAQYLIHAVSKKIVVPIAIKCRVGVIIDGQVEIQLRKVNKSGHTLTDVYDAVHTAGDIIEIDYSSTITLEQGDKLSFVTHSDGEVFTTNRYAILEGGTIAANYEVTFDPTFCKGLSMSRLAAKLVDKLSDGKCSFSSQFLDSIEDVLYTSGQSLRNLPDAVFKISWNDFYKSLQRFAVMLGTKNDQIIIEDMATAFNNEVIVDLGTVSNLEVYLAEDMVYNTVKTGYQNQTYDNVNGRDEFNVTQQWNTPILKVIKELDLVSPVRADMYGIELTRLELFGKDTTDSASDNDTFFLSVEKGANIKYYEGPIEVKDDHVIVIPRELYQIANGTTIVSETLGALTVTNTSYLIVGCTSITVSQTIADGEYSDLITYSDPEVYKLKRRDYDSLTGLLHPEGAFNVELSPKRALINNYRFLTSFMEDQSWLLKFQSGEKNSELSTEIGGVTITEKENIQVSDMGLPFYLPHYFEFSTEVPINFRNIIALNPYGTIKFNDEKGNVFYGYMWDGDWKPGTNERSKWKLLCSPLTNKNLLK